MPNLLAGRGFILNNEDYYQIYYDMSDYSKPIKVSIDNINNVIVTSRLFNDIGTFTPKNSTIEFNKLGKCKINKNSIDFDNDNVWGIDTRRKILFIGANDMAEIYYYAKGYNYGLFIEAIPNIFNKMVVNLNNCNKVYSTNFIGLNYLTTNENGKEYTFNIFNNNSASSSIYDPNDKEWAWNDVKKIDEIKLKSTRVKTILDKYNFDCKDYDLILDVQGAELEVLKSFDEYLNYIKKIKVEVSQKEYYSGGVLFNDLHGFLVKHGFQLETKHIPIHGDVIYTKNNIQDCENISCFLKKK